MPYIQNPILPGFHPDPSICRVHDTYYIATSTFQWFPGVRIHQSKDLVRWEHAAYALDRVSQLDMLGIEDSAGVWAPCLSYANGQFWLIYTNSRTIGGVFKDAPNYLVTAENIEGPWSEPIFLNASGFDPSLFHDDDGRQWLINMIWDHRPGKNRFNGIRLQEYDHQAGKLIGDYIDTFPGTELGCTEGPHIYKKDGWYYLLTAEGGTGYRHAVTMARSTEITGPYEVDPENPMLTAFGTNALIQKAGHADIIDTPEGDWYMVHLCSRKVNETTYCPLGRETAIQKVHWTKDGWLRLEAGGNTPFDSVQAPVGYKGDPPAIRDHLDEFDTEVLSHHFNTLRVPADEKWITLKERPGWLRLKGLYSMESTFEQALVALRVQSITSSATTLMDFQPTHFQEMAGLTAYYDNRAWYYLRVSHEENHGKTLCLTQKIQGEYREDRNAMVKLPDGVPVHLKVTIDHTILQFFWSIDAENWMQVSEDKDALMLSDDASMGWGFTGAYFGVACQDISGMKKHADFDYFHYVESADQA